MSPDKQNELDDALRDAQTTLRIHGEEAHRSPFEFRCLERAAVAYTRAAIAKRFSNTAAAIILAPFLKMLDMLEEEIEL